MDRAYENKENLELKIHSWLSKQGYPLEMKFAERVRKLTDFNIRQGWHFKDPETGISREIDIVCTKTDPSGLAEINFIIECKGTNKPWIIFTSEDAASSYHRLASFGILSGAAFSYISKTLFSIEGDLEMTRKRAKEIPWLWKEGRIGYNITQAFEGGSDAPYIGSLSAIKASLWLLDNSLWQSTFFRHYVVNFPVVVTNSPLFEGYLDDSGELCLQRINKGYLFFTQKISNYSDFTGSCISIVSCEGIDQFVQDCSEVANAIFDILKPAIEEGLDDLKNHKPDATDWRIT